MLVYLFFLFVSLTILHFIWEGIISPSLRLVFRQKLFKLRDQLRWLKVTHPDELSDEVFLKEQENINRAIRVFHRVKLTSLLKFLSQEDNFKKLKRSLENPELVETSCELREFERIEYDTAKILACSLVFNSIGSMVILTIFALLGGSVVLLAQKLTQANSTEFNDGKLPRRRYAS